eukprot:TCONS_00005737-protein
MTSPKNQRSTIHITLLVILLALLHQSHSRPSSSSNRSTFTKALGNRQFRICKARTFSFFLHTVCLHYRPARNVYKKVGIRKRQDNNILDRKEARSFIKSRRRRSTDQNYMDECCGPSKHGCNVNEIFEYCNYVPLPQIVLMRRKKFS